jgi:hypothetical protein
MEFSPNNKIVKLCLQGIVMEEKSKLFFKHGTKQQSILKNLLQLILPAKSFQKRKSRKNYSLTVETDNILSKIPYFW